MPCTPIVDRLHRHATLTPAACAVPRSTYKEDPTVFGWELMNEPRNYDDSSGNTLQAWIDEMSAYVKSIDSLHMLTVGEEGA